jgi:hypothetical protein
MSIQPEHDPVHSVFQLGGNCESLSEGFDDKDLRHSHPNAAKRVPKTIRQLAGTLPTGWHCWNGG